MVSLAETKPPNLLAQKRNIVADLRRLQVKTVSVLDHTQVLRKLIDFTEISQKIAIFLFYFFFYF